MDLTDAREAIAAADSSDLEDRAHRLVELNAALPDGHVALAGEAADLLFADVKATWIYGYFAATTVVAASFCIQQVAGRLRLFSDDDELPIATKSLEEVAALAHERSLIDIDLRAELVALHDAAQVYSFADLHEDRRAATERAMAAAHFSDHDHLLEDARLALRCSIAVLEL